MEIITTYRNAQGHHSWDVLVGDVGILHKVTADQLVSRHKFTRRCLRELLCLPGYSDKGAWEHMLSGLFRMQPTEVIEISTMEKAV